MMGAVRKRFVGLVVVLVVMGLPASASAHGSSMPGHRIGRVLCSYGTVRVYTPPYVRSWFDRTFYNPAIVEWSPDLYKWRKRRGRYGWRLYNGQAPWYSSIAARTGLWGSWKHPNGTAIIFVKYRSLTRGYYKVRNYFWWDEVGVRHRQASRWCYVPRIIG
jgi:hypothetical protein